MKEIQDQLLKQPWNTWRSGCWWHSFFGPEPEFFVFDDVKFQAEMNSSFYNINSTEGPYNSGSDLEEGNMGHRPGIKGGYFPVPPVDSAQDLRSEMVLSLVDMGVPMEAPSWSCSISTRIGT